MEACDEMLKSSNVELVLASPACPGKYIVILEM
ncbi:MULTISPECIES: BMC domain-containing protein [Clostridium]|jgi:microcompartment protein CcmL/EutN|uniref:Microcompartment protein CcmL/EutN n=2 Tax=Clostridium TaxID=1485 RepID=A0AAX0B9S8_CLOBE|nr:MULTISPECIES: BMC domain-containing protein [Clostridium]MBA8933291.1 microcompartment protein CcmL/EutN [Clostridium beijerinckii]NRT36763.1 microcompartment protein CcmL/EutN [Clostridium beijerinckii]NRT43804.1 microcompartment protein CcmL/EutN [Clostridium beijerinckii]NRT91707.1 microcompartment protein CcmL/EutN [Clostridium beijerinckii]NRU37492.1 microcompartment protein CcmL/EutN [Clostridium beijerinckii]